MNSGLAGFCFLMLPGIGKVALMGASSLFLFGLGLKIRQNPERAIEIFSFGGSGSAEFFFPSTKHLLLLVMRSVGWLFIIGGALSFLFALFAISYANLFGMRVE